MTGKSADAVHQALSRQEDQDALEDHLAGAARALLNIRSLSVQLDADNFDNHSGALLSLAEKAGTLVDKSLVRIGAAPIRGADWADWALRQDSIYDKGTFESAAPPPGASPHSTPAGSKACDINPLIDDTSPAETLAKVRGALSWLNSMDGYVLEAFGGWPNDEIQFGRYLLGQCCSAAIKAAEEQLAPAKERS